MRFVVVVFAAVSALSAIAVVAGCNNPGTCPAASSVVPGGSCSGDNLQCPYSVPGAAGGASSCVCTDGKWACPTPGDDGGSDASSDDGGSGDATSGEASSPEAGTGDANEGGSLKDAASGG